MRRPGIRLPRFAFLLVALILAGALAGAVEPAAAQTAVVEEIPISIGPSGQEYLEVAERRGVRVSIRYLDERIRIEPPAAEPEGGVLTRLLRNPSTVFWFMVAVFAGVLLFTLSFGASYGGLPTASLARRPEDGRRRDAHRSRVGTDTGDAADARTWVFPDDLLRMDDRRAALVLLLNRALQRAAELNGMVLVRSETARGMLRALPRGWPHLAALRRLVEEEELVHFGGRDIREQAFGECIEIARPLFAERGRL